MNNSPNNSPVPLSFQKEEVFLQAFEIARIANFDEKQLFEYEESLKHYRDLKGVIDTSFEDGEMRKAKEIAAKLKAKGIDIDIIIETTGLSKEEIEKS